MDAGGFALPEGYGDGEGILATFRRKIREVRKAASVGQATHQKLVEW